MDRTKSTIGVAAAALVFISVAQAQTLNTLYSFGHNELGYQPYAGVTVGPGGALFGTTPYGGAWGIGAAYELTPPASPGGAWTYVLLHSFNPSDGEGPPPAGVAPTLGPSGVLYSVTEYSNAGNGSVFQLLPPGLSSTHWRDVTLLAFAGMDGFGPGGDGPGGAPAFGPGGALYGTTTVGGAVGSGALYRLVPSMQGAPWTETVLYSFNTYAGDGKEPAGPLAVAGNGAIYGVTESGGASGIGTVFRLAPPAEEGGAWTETLLHTFAGPGNGGDWGLPNGVVLGPGGALYGTAIGGLQVGHQGPCTACGTVFQLTPPPSPGRTWTETILHNFSGGGFAEDGTEPNSPPVMSADGALYGTTLDGGIYDYGTIFALLPPSSPGAGWTEKILYAFTGGADGGSPTAVTLGPDGNLYGTTEFGGVAPDGTTNQGTIFQLVLQ